MKRSNTRFGTTGPTSSLPGIDELRKAESEAGLALLAALLTTALVATLVWALSVQNLIHWRMLQGVEARLYSLVLAQNGIEFARGLLPLVDVDELLAGPDGSFSGTDLPEWRNPLPFSEARRMDPESWTPDRDDGLPARGRDQLLPNGYSDPGGGHFYLRFSNNPEEPAHQDRDGVVLVRSMGVAPLKLQNPFLASTRNSVTLIESRLLQETAFRLRSALTLAGDDGDFHWAGSQFLLDGGHREPAVRLLSLGGDGLGTEFLRNLSPAQAGRIRGAGPEPSLRDSTDAYREDPRHRSLFQAVFWKHFQDQLPNLSSAAGIVHLPEGGTLSGAVSGVVIARGNLILQGDVRFRGILLHLGGGGVILKDRARIVGGLWLSNLSVDGETIRGGSLSLHLSDLARVRYDADAIRSGLRSFPPTQLGWRLLFPEMKL